MADDLTGCLGENMARMYRVALRLTGQPDLAQDVVQEACVKALSHWQDFQDRSLPATWLHTITLNCARDYLRSHQRSEVRMADIAVQLEAIGAPEVLPSAAIERCERLRQAWELLDALPQECRSAFVLTQLDGYSYDEAAAIEGKSRGTMASRVFRARKILLEKMKGRKDV